MIELFIKGGPIMWPLLVTSLTALTVILERFWFILAEQRKRNPDLSEDLLELVEKGRIDDAIARGRDSADFVVRALVNGLLHREESLSRALLRASNSELKRFNRGLSILDTIITLAPLLGLLGTVVGMIHSFNLMGADELGAPVAITGGIAEALIATGFGLAVAILALIPFNYLNARLEEARHELEDACTHLEMLLVKKEA